MHRSFTLFLNTSSHVLRSKRGIGSDTVTVGFLSIWIRRNPMKSGLDLVGFHCVPLNSDEIRTRFRSKRIRQKLCRIRSVFLWKMSDSDEIRHESDRKQSDLQVCSLALGFNMCKPKSVSVLLYQTIDIRWKFSFTFNYTLELNFLLFQVTRSNTKKSNAEQIMNCLKKILEEQFRAVEKN